MKDFAKIKLSLSSPDNVREQSYGEVLKPETINYRTLVPEKDGLFCEAIFGPVKDWQCSCGKYKRIRYKGIVCEKCGVEVTHSKVRRERMGHIELAAPIAHIWYLKGIPNNMSILLGVAPKDLESVAYFSKNIIINPGKTAFALHDVVVDKDCKIAESLDSGDFKYGTGAEALLTCLKNLNLEVMLLELKQELSNCDSLLKRKKIIKKIELVSGMIESGNDPSWMIFQVLPVMPADLRPMVQLDGGRFATSDLNDLYRRVINRNKRLKKLQSMFAPEIILKNEKRMLQEAVDALIDNSRKENPSVTQNNRDLKSLSGMLRGKQGRFRQNLLGKRVDYSGRSVIVVGPDLKLNQCGLPKKMALELYKPFIIRSLVERGLTNNIKSAKRLIDSEADIVWPIVEDIIKGHPILLNRPPSLHKFSIQAFEPVLIEGKAIRLHPLVCSGFNADFDGDQMSVHLPLSPHSIMEARTIMLASNILISPSDGNAIVSPSREMLMGCYYVTTFRKGVKGEGKIFNAPYEAKIAYENGIIAVNAAIKVRVNGIMNETTVGRILFNELLPESLRDYSKPFMDKDIKKLIATIFKIYGTHITSEIVNKIKDFGFKYGTLAGITISVDDLVIPSTKAKIVEAADRKVNEIDKRYLDGKITSQERYREILDNWNAAVEQVVHDLVEEIDDFNPVFMMSKSGARGGLTQMRQLSGMRGLLSDTQGRVMEIPVKSNFREGLTVLEFFMSSYGARKGSADKALRTADSGYLTRRLVDVAHDVIVVDEDCNATEGIYIKDIVSDDSVVESFKERLIGRTLSKEIEHKGEILAKRNEMITEELAKWIVSKGVEGAEVRSPMTCQSHRGICVKCYGMDLATHREVVRGEAVGVIAAQSVGERGTQLTMRTFHTGGVSERAISESEIKVKTAGKVKLLDLKTVSRGKDEIVIENGRIAIEEDVYVIPTGSTIKTKSGMKVKEGDVIAITNPYANEVVTEFDGYLDFSEILISKRVDTRFNKTERRVSKSKSNEDVSFINIRKTKKGEIIARYPVFFGAYLLGEDGDKVEKGSVVAKISKKEKKSAKDITGGLPRVQQLLEVRTPQSKAILSEIDGVISIDKKQKEGIKIITVQNIAESRDYLIPGIDNILVSEGDEVAKGDQLTEGVPFIGDYVEIMGIKAAKEYIVEAVQEIYIEQGARINDKHLEIIVRQMFRKVRVIDGGDSIHLEGSIVPTKHVEEMNRELKAQGNREITYVPVVQGITKAAIDTESFISAASFQDTTKVLANAAIRGKIDNLEGLKENVIIGRRIPAGTGFEDYRSSEEK